jgi:formamidopyrimidine-DNA glycosylase (fpg)
MPELPEVETTVRGLARILENARIVAARVNRPDMRRPFPIDLVQTMTGARITGMGRRAKYGLIHSDRDRTLVFHLGMSGRWRIDPVTPDRHDHLVLTTDRDNTVVLNDPRRFGWVDLAPTRELDSWGPFASLGPEPLGPELTIAHLRQAFSGRTAPVKQLLLDQSIVAGLGNIYVCEALFRARIRPDRPAGEISPQALARLVPAIRDVLTESIAAGGSTIRDYAQPSGELGYFAASWNVYGREGEACACGAPIRRFVQGGRGTFWCKRCQR